jgi:VWFA-related protein
MRLPTLLALATALPAVVLGFAPRPAAQGQAFTASTRTVAIYATVTDSGGRLVPDLEQEHFEVFDNRVQRPVTLFKRDVQPITVVVMLDTSASMTHNLKFLQVAAEQFLIRLLPEDRARVGSFSDKVVLSPVFTSDREALVRFLFDNMRMFGNPTHLWDALDESMTALAGETGRRVVLVFTDGEDDLSRRRNARQVLARAEEEDFMIYAIGLQSEFLGRITRPDRNLRRLAEQTGGGFFELRRTADLNTTFTGVISELHRQYVIGFSPEKLDGTLHTLEVRSKVPGTTVRARKSYLAADRKDAPASREETRR